MGINVQVNVSRIFFYVFPTLPAGWAACRDAGLHVLSARALQDYITGNLFVYVLCAESKNRQDGENFRVHFQNNQKNSIPTRHIGELQTKGALRLPVLI